MSDFSLALTESPTLRNKQLSELSSDKALESLNKAKALVMAFWRGESICTTSMIADFYEVSEDVIRDNVRRHRDEFESDGLKVLRGKDLRGVREMFSLSPNTPNETIWNPRSALRLGMLLRDSEVAKRVRDTLLDVVAIAPAQNDRIRELELENENLKLKTYYFDRRSAVQEIHGAGMLALLDGRPDVVVPKREVVTESVICKDGRTVSFTGKSLADLGKELGFKTGKEFERWLERVGRGDLVSQGMRAVQAPYVAEEHIAEVRRLWAERRSAPGRQMLLGE